MSEETKVKSETANGKGKLRPKDFALYLGCYVLTEKHGIGKLTSVNIYSGNPRINFDKIVDPGIGPNGVKYKSAHLVGDWNIILRPLLGMTADEFRKIFEDPKVSDRYTETYIEAMASSRYELFQYLSHHDPGNALQRLLDHHFDLFNWIDAGLAIDATTLSPNPYEPSNP